MAFFEFNCDKCGHVFEVLKFGSLEENEKKCPECGSSNVSQIFGSFGLSTNGNCGSNGFSFG